MNRSDSGRKLRNMPIKHLSNVHYKLLKTSQLTALNRYDLADTTKYCPECDHKGDGEYNEDFPGLVVHSINTEHKNNLSPR